MVVAKTPRSMMYIALIFLTFLSFASFALANELETITHKVEYICSFHFVVRMGVFVRSSSTSALVVWKPVALKWDCLATPFPKLSKTFVLFALVKKEWAIMGNN
jgi:hypothetical protein